MRTFVFNHTLPEHNSLALQIFIQKKHSLCALVSYLDTAIYIQFHLLELFLDILEQLSRNHAYTVSIQKLFRRYVILLNNLLHILRVIMIGRRKCLAYSCRLFGRNGYLAEIAQKIKNGLLRHRFQFTFIFLNLSHVPQGRSPELGAGPSQGNILHAKQVDIIKQSSHYLAVYVSLVLHIVPHIVRKSHLYKEVRVSFIFPNQSAFSLWGHWVRKDSAWS